MEFISGMHAVCLAYFAQVIVICRVLVLFVHHYLYRTPDIVAVFSSLVLCESLDWHNLKADSEDLKFAEGFSFCKLIWRDSVQMLLTTVIKQFAPYWISQQ